MVRFDRVRKASRLLVVAVGCLGARVLAQQPGDPRGIVRTDIAGEWTPVTNEDQEHRGPGPELGDFTGLPLNDADRQKADAWNATILSQPERQSQAHPVQYLLRGPGPNLRILKILDPITQELVAYTVAGGFGRADRVIWMDGRSHPSDFSEHTWDGFSTGKWENGVLAVTTTHMKQGHIQRNGSATSPYGVMTEHYFRHGEYMTVFWRVDDPIFLDEPMIRTHTWHLAPNQNLTLGDTFEAVDELGDKPLGWVPFYPLGVTHPEFAETHGLPFLATRGGKESLYPEYMAKIEELRKQEAARQAAGAVKQDAVKKK